MAQAQQRPQSHPCHVAVVQWFDQDWRVARFRRCNPSYPAGPPFVDGGVAGLDPAVQFDKHSAGIPSKGLVRQCGLDLLRALYKRYNPRPDALAQTLRFERGTALRQRGYGMAWGVRQASCCERSPCRGLVTHLAEEVKSRLSKENKQ